MEALSLNSFPVATPLEEGGGNNFPSAELSHSLHQLQNYLRLEQSFVHSSKSAEMNPTSPSPDAKWKLQAQDEVSLPLMTFENWKKSTLQLLQKEIHDRKTEALPSALSNSHYCQHPVAFSCFRATGKLHSVSHVGLDKSQRGGKPQANSYLLKFPRSL